MKNSFFLTIRMFIVLIVSLYTVRVILKELGAVDYGIYNVIGGLVSMFGFLNASMNNATQRFYNFEIGKNGYNGGTKVFNTALLIQSIIAVLTFCLVETIGLWFLYNKMVIPEDRFSIAFWIFHFSTIGLMIIIMQIPFSASIIAHERMDYFALISILDVFFTLALALSIPYSPIDKLLYYGLFFLIIKILNFLCYFIYAKINFKEIRFNHYFEKKLFRDMLSFSGWNLFGSLSRTGKEQGFNMLLNVFFGPTVNAARGLAYQISAASQSFVNSITTPARPQLTQSYAQGNVKRSIYIMYMISKLSYMSVLLLSLPIVYEIYFILHIWLGDTVPEHTYNFARLVILATLIRIFSPSISFIVHASGIMKKYQLYTSTITIAFIPVAYIFLKMGANAEFVFFIAAIFTLLSLISGIIIASKIIPFSFWKYIQQVIIPMLFITLISVGFCYVPHLLINEGWERLIITSLLSLISISISGYYIGLNSKEKKALSEIVKKKLKKK